ncbi:MAG: DNA-3-methyladenine glycosylase [Clostridiales bacterium]
MGKYIKDKKLSRDFYTRELFTVAKELLGKKFVRLSNNNLLLSGKIVEVEAYDGSVDQAAHTFRGKTPRNEVMFRQGGYLYVYFTYGMYYCCNVVTGNENEGKAVLIRAIEPLEGIVQMAVNRFQKDFINDKELRNLANGPGKLCMAFGITKEYNGTDLSGERIFLLDQKKIPEENIISTTRIGITKSVELPWRFYIKNNPYVSHR